MISMWLLLSFFVAEAFVVPLRTAPSTTTSLKVGNFISGVTGIPPSQLVDARQLETLVEGTSLQNTNLECAYKASRDGWSAIDFHQKMDGRGSGLVVILSRSGAVFGGFNPLGWMSTDDYGSSNAAFLWFSKGGKEVKCPVLAGGNAASFDYATGGPCFGAADLQLGPPQAAVMGGFAGPDMENTALNAGNLKVGKSNVGGAYEFLKGWPVGGSFSLADVEIYCNGDIQSSSSGGGPSWWPF